MYTVVGVRPAIFITMGVNINISVTNTFVSLRQSLDRHELRREFAEVTVHDIVHFFWQQIFNLVA